MALGGLRIGTVRGVPIRIHFSLLLVLPLLAVGFARAFRAAARMADVPPEHLQGSPWLWGLGVALALFASVLVHELAHSLYALRRGGRVRGITLLVIGGVSEISEMPQRSRHEAIMALLGPVVSIAIGAVCVLVHALVPTSSFNLRFGLFYLGGLNLLLGAFNLLPAYPMDGGRVLRAVLAGRIGLVRATHVAARIGKAFAVAFAIWGFLSFNMLLLLVAFFVFVGAHGETRAVVARALLGELRVRDVMGQAAGALPAEISVHDAAERMLRERRTVFVVTSGGEPQGLITLDAVKLVPVDKRAGVRVRDVMKRTPTLSPVDDATKALRLLGEADVPQLPVADGSRLVGVVGREDIARALELNELEATQNRSGRWPRWQDRDAPA